MRSISPTKRARLNSARLAERRAPTSLAPEQTWDTFSAVKTATITVASAYGNIGFSVIENDQTCWTFRIE